jgi:HB1, ASXL, restriction endonuclease HTH domain
LAREVTVLTWTSIAMVAMPDHHVIERRTTMTAKKTTKTASNGAKHAPKAKKAKKPRRPTSPAAKTSPKKLSALDAAARILQETNQPMTCQELIESMAAKGYWKSPAGKTPHSTLYSAMLREIGVKGKEARFKKTERGKFALA